MTWQAVLAVALAHSIGWGVRGQWGHEAGAMIPGALSALAAVIFVGRADWLKRFLHCAFFAALGWSFGGSMSYMKVLAFTHSDSAPDVFYGYAMIFVIGFLWGVPGGAGLALPATLDTARLKSFFGPVLAISASWIVLGQLTEWLGWEPNWYDSDWLGVSLGLAAVLAYRLWKGPSFGASLILHMGLGWWGGFLLFPVLLGLRMTPPRGDNWAGSLGLCVALMWFFRRNGMHTVLQAALITGFSSGVGFVVGQWLKLCGVSTGIVTNWHSVTEQSYGFIAGLGVALAAYRLAAQNPPLATEVGELRGQSTAYAAFLLVVMTWVNISKNLNSVWLKAGTVPAHFYGLDAYTWFSLAYLALAGVILLLLRAHLHHPLAILPASNLGRSQLLFAVLLWWIVLGNLSRVLPFAPERLITEGMIHLNACAATLLVLVYPREHQDQTALPRCPRFAIWAVASVIVTGLLSWHTLSLYDGPAPGAQFRFGPRSNNQQR
ncbi:hypothetical protein [Paludibaculum fermentans]|uniref:Uncharacterized protein n=1 Tax=Paludibaculum fermentans TaxID=1473598 RepID=A0A7S7NN49_PALFE|nr:hypothetical protein [Paludibaculum fermentans]QOY86660.1 hypothetical protein IRI77_28300 [Paludibaculum fermentans]